MLIETTRFGRIKIQQDDVLTFPLGLIGMETCREWVLLADSENKALGWLQSTERPDLALAVVSPRRFVSDYRVRVSSREVADLGVAEGRDVQVLVVVSQMNEGLTLNLKAPLVIHVKNRKGRQVVAKDEHAVQYFLGATVPFRQSA